MLTGVEQIITTAHKDLQSCVHRPTNEPRSHAKNQVSLTLTYFKVKIGQVGTPGVERRTVVSVSLECGSVQDLQVGLGPMLFSLYVLHSFQV